MRFTGWMRLQRGRDDGVGDLARLASAEGDFPAGRGGYGTWAARLKAGRFDARVFHALDRAWREYVARG